MIRVGDEKYIMNFGGVYNQMLIGSNPAEISAS